MPGRSLHRVSLLAEAGQSPMRVEASTTVCSEAEALLRPSEAAAVAPSGSGGGAAKLAGAQCPICMEELTDGGVTVLPGCSHAFHGSCIGEWFRRAPAPTCPSCRRDMTKQGAYMKAQAAIESHESRGSEETAAAAALRVRRVEFRRHIRERRRDGLLSRVYRAAPSDGQRQRQVVPGVVFSPVVLTPRDDAPLFRFDPTV